MKDITHQAASRLRDYSGFAMLSSDLRMRSSQPRLQSQTYIVSHKGHQR